MAYNTPFPLQVVKGTAEQIAETIIPERVIVSDPVNKITVIGDGVTKGGVPFGANEQWNNVYDGTLEELQADPDALAAFLKNMPKNGFIVVKSDKIVNEDGTINEEELKAYLEDNYLKLTGGTLTGAIVSNRLHTPTFIRNEGRYSRGETVATDAYNIIAQMYDKDEDLLLQEYLSFTNSWKTWWLALFTEDSEGNAVRASISLMVNPNGTAVFTCPTPLATAPDAVVYNREALYRDFLPKTGGEVTGAITRKAAWGISDELSEVAYATTIGVQDKTGLNVAQNAVRRMSDRIGSYVSVTNNGVMSILEAVVTDDGEAYVSVPSPSNDAYGNYAANTKYVKDNFVQAVTKSLNTYVGGANASDTADLGNGRGLTSDKPFANIMPAMDWVLSHYNIGNHIFVFIVQDNLDLGSANDLFLHAQGAYCYIQSADANNLKRIKANRFIVYEGHLHFRNIELEAYNTLYCMQAATALGHISLGDTVNFYGNLTSATHGGCVYIPTAGTVSVSSAATIGGNFTGKRFHIAGVGTILSGGKGVNAFPGTQAGVVEGSAKYV